MHVGDSSSLTGSWVRNSSGTVGGGEEEGNRRWTPRTGDATQGSTRWERREKRAGLEGKVDERIRILLFHSFCPSRKSVQRCRGSVDVGDLT